MPLLILDTSVVIVWYKRGITLGIVPLITLVEQKYKTVISRRIYADNTTVVQWKTKKLLKAECVQV